MFIWARVSRVACLIKTSDPNVMVFSASEGEFGVWKKSLKEIFDCLVRFWKIVPLFFREQAKQLFLLFC